MGALLQPDSTQNENGTGRISSIKHSANSFLLGAPMIFIEAQKFKE
jgi:hypothetical protein